MLKKTQSKVFLLLTLLISMMGYVPSKKDYFRLLLFGISIFFSLYLSIYQESNFGAALSYFVIFEIAYFAYVTTLLSENGYRLKLISRLGEDKAYSTYQTWLGFIFYHNGASLGYVAATSPGNFLEFLPTSALYVIVFILFIIGFVTKVSAAWVVKIDVYYWKDMFVGRPVSEFVSSGPYRFFKNPMYGIGQLQGYAVAVYYQSKWGLLACALNQAAVFTFYHLTEKKFIDKVYSKNSSSIAVASQ